MSQDFNQHIRLRKCQNLASLIADQVDLSPAVFDAIATTERELFVPAGFRHHAYTLDALPLSSNQWISSPLTVAKMTQALGPEGCDSVLEVGCGSGYQAAVLSKLFRRVFTIERIEDLLREAKKRFETLGIRNIHARFDDGQRGWRDFAPFDRILLSASIQKIPETLFEQLANGGILVAPIEKDREQIITCYTKSENGISSKTLGSCLFVPVKDGMKN
ncbi:MAG: protein-L-isoaspartate(D-aspartate) O-methyltransferase [Campylobacteraceae bacterium]|nr:protein-L-isoaspartate(D-aspartate) O-methyltransferase [Campylobacteraceae bacterium]